MKRTDSEHMVDKRMVLQFLGLRGDEKEPRNQRIDHKDRPSETRADYEIVNALNCSSVDAVKVTRCGDCHWCLRYHTLRMPRCICPEMPPHFVREDGYCNYGKPKGGGENGR